MAKWYERRTVDQDHRSVFDELLVDGNTDVHVEMLDENALWIGITDKDNDRKCLSITIVGKTIGVVVDPNHGLDDWPESSDWTSKPIAVCRVPIQQTLDEFFERSG